MRHSLALLLSVCLWTGPLQAQSARRDYYHGDWVSYVVQRFISGFAQGFEVVYIGTPYGVGRFSSLQNRFLPPLTASSGLDDTRILRLAYDDGTGTLWVQTPSGTASYHDVIEEWRRGGTFPSQLVAEHAASLRFDNLFTPWGLSYFPPDRSSPHGLFRDQQLRSYPITTALKDAVNSNRIWIGAWGYGLGEIDRHSYQTAFRPYGPHQRAVLALYRGDDAWYFGGRGEANEPPVISLLKHRDSSWSYQQPFYSLAARGEITVIAGLKSMRFYGTPDGLLKYDSAAERWRRYSRFDGLPGDQITALHVDDELIWVGTTRGPGLLDPVPDTGRAAISMVTPAIGEAPVFTFASAFGYVWAGTETGLYRIRARAGDWTRIATADGLLRGRVRALAARPEGIWCATDGGLVLVDSELVALEVFRDRVELSDGDLFTLAVDDANVWAGSPSGVWRYFRAQQRWRLYTRQDGLLEDLVYDLELDGDYIWFGCSTGVTRFYWNNSLRLD